MSYRPESKKCINYDRCGERVTYEVCGYIEIPDFCEKCEAALALFPMFDSLARSSLENNKPQ